MSTEKFVEPLCYDYKYLFRPDLLKGKVAFITGGGSGICFTIAEIFMRHQCDTVIVSRNLTRLQASSKCLENATGQKCLPVKADVRKPEEIKEAVIKALQEFQRIDILINGAAGNFLCPAAKLSFNAFRTVMDIDTMGTFNASKIVFEKYMKDHGGVIVNITSTQHLSGVPMQCHVGAAKSAIEALTKHLAVEWGPNNVRIMCVAPGPVEETEGYRRLAGPASKEDILKIIPIRKIGTRCDIANIILFVVSEAAGLLTGSCIIADGGSWMGMMSAVFNQIPPPKL